MYLPSGRAQALVLMLMAGQAARISGVTVRDRRSAVRRDNIDVEVDHALAGNVPTGAAHSMRGVAGGAGEAIISVPRMLGEAGVRHDLRQVVTLLA